MLIYKIIALPLKVKNYNINKYIFIKYIFPTTSLI